MDGLAQAADTFETAEIPMAGFVLFKAALGGMDGLADIIIFAFIMERVVPIHMPVLIAKGPGRSVAHGGAVQSNGVNKIRHGNELDAKR